MEEKSVPKSSEKKRDTLVQSQGNWHYERARETDTEMEGEGDRERVRVTSRGLISEVNHIEQQRESPGWKISDQEERLTETDREGVNKREE